MGVYKTLEEAKNSTPTKKIDMSRLNLIDKCIIAHWDKDTENFKLGWDRYVTYVPRYDNVYQAKIAFNGVFYSAIGYGKKEALDRLKGKLRIKIANNFD